MLTGLVHRAFLLVGAARHAGFGGSEPALALGEMSGSATMTVVSAAKRLRRPQHILRMLNGESGVKSLQFVSRASVGHRAVFQLRVLGQPG